MVVPVTEAVLFGPHMQQQCVLRPKSHLLLHRVVHATACHHGALLRHCTEPVAAAAPWVNGVHCLGCPISVYKQSPIRLQPEPTEALQLYALPSLLFRCHVAQPTCLVLLQLRTSPPLPCTATTAAVTTSSSSLWVGKCCKPVQQPWAVLQAAPHYVGFVCNAVKQRVQIKACNPAWLSLTQARIP